MKGKILPENTSFPKRKQDGHLERIIVALRSETRRKILKILVSGPKNVREVFDLLPTEGVEVKYLSSVYKALETLVDCGLVEKYYDRRKGLLYRILNLKIDINLLEL